VALSALLVGFGIIIATGALVRGLEQLTGAEREE